MERSQERHPARDRVVYPFEETEGRLKEAYVQGYQQGKKDATLSWGGKFWVTVVMFLIGIPLLLGWIALVEFLMGLV